MTDHARDINVFQAFSEQKLSDAVEGDCSTNRYQLLDSMAVDSAGNVCVATLLNGGITVIAPDGTVLEHVATPDPLTTNICFGGSDLRIAYITLTTQGKLVAMDWPRSGLPLHYTA